MSQMERLFWGSRSCLAAALFACLPALCAAANLYTVDLVLTPPGATNTIDLAITATLLGQTKTDSDTGTVTGNMIARLGVTIDGADMRVTDVETIEFTGGRIAISDMDFALSWFLVGSIDVESTAIQATMDTPSPPGTVSGGSFNAAEHVLIMDRGSFIAEGSGLIEDYMPANPYVVDLAAEPIEVTTEATGTITVSAPSIAGGQATYDVTLTLPVSISEVVLEEPDVATVSAIGSTTLQARGSFSQPLPDFGAIAPPAATGLEEAASGATSFVRGAGDTEIAWSLEAASVAGVAAVDGSFTDPDSASNQKQFHVNNADVVIVTESIDVRGQEDLRASIDLRTWDTSTGFEADDNLRLEIRVSDDGLNYDQSMSWLSLAGASLTALNGGRDGPLVTYISPEGLIPAGAKSIRIAISVENNSANEHVFWDNLRVGIVIEEGTRFLRGDANASGSADLSDAVTILGHLFLGNPTTLLCRKAADTDRGGSIDLTDAIYLLSHLFLGGSAPPLPFGECGLDEEDERLTCESFPPCEG